VGAGGEGQGSFLGEDKINYLANLLEILLVFTLEWKKRADEFI